MSTCEARIAHAVLGATLALAVLAGCAAPPRQSQGLQWVLEQDAERKRLNDAGFPQYTGAW